MNAQYRVEFGLRFLHYSSGAKNVKFVLRVEEAGVLKIRRVSPEYAQQM